MEHLPELPESEDALKPPVVDVEFLRELIALVEREDLAELTVRWGEVSVTVRGVVSPAAPLPFAPLLASIAAPTVTGQAASVEVPSQPVSAVQDDARLFRITAPLTGVFYSRPRPDSPPFVTVGMAVEPGQVVALVEAMKFFNEIRSEVSGVVREIVAKDGQLVKQGDTLILVERSA